jgi:hypothetical protein
VARLLSAQLIVTPLLCALIDVLTTGEEVCAEAAGVRE